MAVRHPPIASATAVASPDAPNLGPSLDWGPLRLLVGAASTADEATAPQVQEVDWDDKMRRYGRRVVVAMIARGVRPERAKELAQDAWLRVIQNYRRGRLRSLELPGVVIAQANFLALDERRRSEQRYVHAPLTSEASTLPDDGRELEGQVAARHQLRKIQGLLERAHPNARRVFEMLYGGNALSAAEIAQELGLSVQRVRQISCELRHKIRRELAEGGRHD